MIILGIPLMLAGGGMLLHCLQHPENEQKSNEYTELFKNMKLIQSNEWVVLKHVQRHRAYNVFSFKLADTIPVARFEENLDFIAEKINAKDEYTNRLSIFYKEGMMHFKIIHATLEHDPFRIIKPPSKDCLLIGHDLDYLPIWLQDVNIFITGTTGYGKSTLMHTLLINALMNRQGIWRLGDIKQTEFFDYKGKQGIACIGETLEEVEQLVIETIAEYNKRIEMLRDKVQYKNYIEYNKAHKEPMEPYFFMMDEFADFAIKWTRKDQPYGVYWDLIQICAKIRCTGGRIILGTQRPSVDIVKGLLKNNFNFVGMHTINAINSRIVIDEEGLENLEERRAKVRQKGTLKDVLAYTLDEDMIQAFIKKIPDKKQKGQA